MKRVVVIIENRLLFGCAKDLLLSVEGLLLNTNPTFYEDVPTADNTTIIFGHICRDVTDDSAMEFREKFNRAYSDMLSEFQDWMEDTQQIPVYLAKSSKVLDLSAFLAVHTLKFASLSLVFALTSENKGNFFQPPLTTLSSRRAEERFASLVAWA